MPSCLSVKEFVVCVSLCGRQGVLRVGVPVCLCVCLCGHEGVDSGVPVSDVRPHLLVRRRTFDASGDMRHVCGGGNGQVVVCTGGWVDMCVRG